MLHFINLYKFHGRGTHSGFFCSGIYTRLVDKRQRAFQHQKYFPSACIEVKSYFKIFFFLSFIEWASSASPSERRFDRLQIILPDIFKPFPLSQQPLQSRQRGEKTIPFRCLPYLLPQALPSAAEEFPFAWFSTAIYSSLHRWCSPYEWTFALIHTRITLLELVESYNLFWSHSPCVPFRASTFKCTVSLL